MTYASQYTGGDEASRRNEATRLLKMLAEMGVAERDDLPLREDMFLRKMYQDLQQPVTGKELLYLRDIKDKYL
jgi:hypothetical protein